MGGFSGIPPFCAPDPLTLRDMEYTKLTYLCAVNRVFGFDCMRASKFVDSFPEPESLMRLNDSQITEGFSPVIRERVWILRKKETMSLAALDVKRCDNEGVRIYCRGDASYPRRLSQIPDSPVVFYVQGRCDLDSPRVLAVVGTRHSSAYAEQRCREVIAHLASLDPLPLIVSGFASGIDICAHMAAVEFGLPTVGVLGTSIDYTYPATNACYRERIVASGGLLSEFPWGCRGEKTNFVMRNRLIAGLSDATFLVESAIKGGGLITARFAADYNRDVFALPGRVTDEYFRGCNSLIASNVAALVENASTISFAMGWEKRPRSSSLRKKLICDTDSAEEKKILLALSSEKTMKLEQLVVATHLAAPVLMAVLTKLEMDKRVISDLFGNYSV